MNEDDWRVYMAYEEKFPHTITRMGLNFDDGDFWKPIIKEMKAALAGERKPLTDDDMNLYPEGDDYYI